MFLLAVFTWPAAAQEVQKEDTMDRIELCRKNYTALFGGEALTGTGTDPELMDILQKYIFGEVFAVGDLDLKTRELITCTVLSVMQTLPQLKAHAAAALTVGVTPVELREAVYQCAPFVGFPKTLNAVSVVNEVFRERGISLPLEAQGTVTEADRYRRGATIQHRLYGDKAGQKTTYVPGGVGGDVARLLTGFCFGDFYTRQGLDLKTRELLVFCMLTTLEADGLLRSHVSGNLELGNTPEILAAAVIQCMPYIGLPPAAKALDALKSADQLPKPVQASPSRDNKVRLSRITVDPERLAEYNVYLEEEIEASMRLEPGVLALYAVADKERPNEITILEIYADEAAYQTHIATPHFRKYKQGTLDMVQSLSLVDTRPLIPGLKIK